jgi:ubiquinone/menaquinone biosynthesis C-methylase UbiE
MLDDPDLPSAQMCESLEDLELVHRRWGASRALVRYLSPRVRALDRRARILDVGAGSGALAESLRRSLAARGAAAKITALDLQWRHLLAGRRRLRRRSPPAVGGDAFRLPFRDGTFDFAVSSLFMHHFSPSENRALLREFLRVAREGFAILDLRRHLVPALALEFAGRVLFRTHLSIRDGVASIRQAYTLDEAAALARSASPTGRADAVFPFGLLLTGAR